MLQPDLGLSTVQRPASAAQRYGQQTISMVRDSAGRSRFEDNLIAVTFFAMGNRIAFDLVNRTDTPIQIAWTEAAFVDPSGQSQPVMHNGVKYSECNGPKAPSVIVANGRLSDSAVPCKYVRLETSYGLGSTPNTYWVEDSYLGLMQVGADSANSVAERRSKELAGRPIRLLLPIKIGDNVNDYTFSFEVRKIVLPTTDGAWKGLVGAQLVALNLVQNGRAIGGTGTIAGTDAGTAQLKVSGTADGTSIAGTMTSAAFSLEFQGTVTGPEIIAYLHGGGFKGDVLKLRRGE
jgi:hypothetical protein